MQGGLSGGGDSNGGRRLLESQSYDLTRRSGTTPQRDAGHGGVGGGGGAWRFFLRWVDLAAEASRMFRYESGVTKVRHGGH